MGSNQEAKSSFPDSKLTNDLRKLCGPVLPSSLSFLLSPSLSTTQGSHRYFSKTTLCLFLPPTQPERKQSKDKNIAWKERARTSPSNVAPVLKAWVTQGVGWRRGGRGDPAGHFQPDHRASLRVGTLALLPSCPHHRTAGSGALFFSFNSHGDSSNRILPFTNISNQSYTFFKADLEDCDVSSDMMLSL